MLRNHNNIGCTKKRLKCSFRGIEFSRYSRCTTKKPAFPSGLLLNQNVGYKLLVIKATYFNSTQTFVGFFDVEFNILSVFEALIIV